MEIIHWFLDIIKFVISGVIIFMVGYLWLRGHLDKYHEMQLMDYKIAIQKNTMPLRLQAYERLILLIERINPSNAIVRLHQTGLTVHDFQSLLIAEINNEYNHNITQQLYVGDNSWNIVRSLKNDTVIMINSAAKIVPANAPAIELGRKILEHLSRLEDQNPYDKGVSEIKQEIQTIF